MLDVEEPILNDINQSVAIGLEVDETTDICQSTVRSTREASLSKTFLFFANMKRYHFFSFFFLHQDFLSSLDTQM